MDKFTELLKDGLPSLTAVVSILVAFYTFYNFYKTSKKGRVIEKKLEEEEKELFSNENTGGHYVLLNGRRVFIPTGNVSMTELTDVIKLNEISEESKAGVEKIDYANDNSKSEETTSFNTIHNLNLIENYYSQALSQSKTSFWFSLAGASIGFCIIILAVIFYQQDRNGVALFTLISGSVIEAVSALFFTQTNRDQKRRSEFFENLRKDKLCKEALLLCESIQDPTAKDALKIQIALSFAGIQDSSQIANSLIQNNLKRETK